MHFSAICTEHLTIDDWRVKAGECWAVIGRNGSGKKHLAQLFQESDVLLSGELSSVDGKVIVLSFENQQTLYEQELHQDDTDFMDHLDPGTTVEELLGTDSLPPSLAFLKLSPLLNRGYRLLSSGESRKVLLAKAILEQPALLILDEPYDSLDLESKRNLIQLFESLLEEKTIRLLFLLNTFEEVSPWHTHVAVLEQGQLIIQGERGNLLENEDVRALLSFDPDSLPAWPDALAEAPCLEQLVNLKDGKVSYQDAEIFTGINLKVAKGQHTLITGANGSGKSTLLSLISGDHPQAYGNELSVLGFQRGQGESIWDLKKQLGLVSPGLHRDHRVPGSAVQIVLSGFFDTIGLYDRATEQQVQHARQWLDLMGLDHKHSSSFKSLSYGEQRLVLIARALVKQPQLLLLDEPTQGLDEVNRRRVLYFLEILDQQNHTTVMMVSHRLDERLSLFAQHLSLDEYS